MKTPCYLALTILALKVAIANTVFAAWGLPIYDANSVSKKKAHTSVSRTIPLYTDAGVVMIVAIAKNNSSTSDGDNEEVLAVTDSRGNNYTKAVEFTNSQGSAQAGATVSVWYKILPGPLEETDSVTATYSIGIDASAIKLLPFPLDAGSSVTIEETAWRADDGADPGLIDLTGVTLGEHLWFRAQAHEGPRTDIINWTSTPTYFTMHPASGTTGNGPASNMTVAAEWDIATDTSNPSDPSWGATPRDEASVLIVFNEIPNPPTN